MTRLSSFERVRVFLFEAVASGPIGFPVVVFPDFIISRFARLAAQRRLPMNIALVVGSQLNEPRLVVAIQAIGQNDQDFALLRGHSSLRSRLRDDQSDE